MKLSEAIRLGAMMRPPAVGGWDDGEKACALLGAALATGIPSRFVQHHCKHLIDYDTLRECFPVLNANAKGPISSEYWDVCSIIAALNDKHRWTREQIAAWVETIEPAQGEGHKALQDDPVERSVGTAELITTPDRSSSGGAA